MTLLLLLRVSLLVLLTSQIADEISASADFGAQFDLFALPISKMVDLLQDKTEGRVYRIQGKIVDHSSVEDWVQAICPECFEM